MTNKMANHHQMQKSDKGYLKGPEITPEIQIQKLNGVKIEEHSVFSPTAPQNKSLVATGLVQGPSSIIELARGLKNNVDLIHEYCANQLDFNPVMGLHKGALGTIIDQRGSAFDLSDAMVQLARQAGYTANYMIGQIRLNTVQAASWLGTYLTDIWAARNLLLNGGIGCSVITDAGIDYVEFNHCWVKIIISGNAYVFDPSFKSYTRNTGADLSAAMGYSSSAFLSRAKIGATITSDYIKNLNRSNIRADLNTMATNLIDWIKNNNYSASLEDLVGSRTINPISTGQRITSLPYQKPGFAPTEYAALPAGYKATLKLVYDDPNINITFYSADIYGKRLTLFFNSQHKAELRLDGSLLATSSAQTSGGWNSIQISVSHPFGSTWADQSVWMRIYTDEKYLIGNSWGYASSKMGNLHTSKFYENQAAGGAANSESVLGEQFTALFYNHNAELSKVADLVNSLTNCITVNMHSVGLVGTIGDVPFVDISEVISSTSALDNNYDRVQWNDTVIAMHGVTLEATAIQEATGPAGVSASTLIDLAVLNGQKLFHAQSSNWASSIKPSLLNYDPALLTDIENWYLNSGWHIVIPENGSINYGSFTGYGFWALPTYGAFGILGGMKGSMGTGVVNNQPPPPPLNSGKPKFTTIAFEDGNFSWSHQDLQIGSQSSPYGISFERYYSSSNSSNDGSLGRGWTHNLNLKVNAGTATALSLGAGNAIATASALVELIVAIDLLSDLSRPQDKFLIASVTSAWLAEMLVNNVVSINGPTLSAQFIRQPDGSFVNPPKTLGTLQKNAATGLFIYTNPQQIKYNFNAAGQISTVVYPFGITWTFTYTGNNLTQVSTNSGRVINLLYTGTRLTSVNDGTGRSVIFNVDSNKNLTLVTDANGKTLKYEYDIPGRMIKAYLAKSLTTPIFTNTYDSIGQVKEQKDAYNNTTLYYYAGYRSETIFANGSSAIVYFNKNGNVTKSLDALSKAVTFEYDGIGRVKKRTYPEGNGEEFLYDHNNNILSRIQFAKPGSGQANITTSFTYHPVFNKITTAIDPMGRTTTFSYNATTGTLTNITYPPIGGLTPIDAFTYNSRGQVLTITDPTNIITRMAYDTATEKLTSVTHDYGTGRKNLVTTYGHNSRGDVTSVQNARGKTTSFTYDNLRNPILKTTPAPSNNQTKFTYDDNGNCVKIERSTGSTPAWQITESTYFIDNRIATRKDPTGNTVSYAYNTMRKLEKITDPLNRDTFYTYDLRGNLNKVADPVSGTEILTQSFTDNNVLASTKDARSNVRTYTYDGHDRPQKTTYPDATFEAVNAYNAMGQPTQIRNRKGQIANFTYDNLGRRKTQTLGSEPTVTYDYDLAGRKISASKPIVSGDGGTGVFSFTYDSAGRIKQETYPDGKSFQYEYDENSNITKVTWPDGYYVTQSYDELDRLKSVKQNGATVDTVTYSYNALSEIQSIANKNGTSISSTFELDEMVSNQIFTFNGSNVSIASQYNNANEITSKTISDMAYVWQPTTASTKSFGTANNIDTYPTVNGIPHTYDSAGALLSNGVSTFTYNVAGQLTQVSKSGNNLSVSYDPLGRQVDKTLNGTTTKIYYAGGARTADYDSSGNLKTRYIYGQQKTPILEISSSGAETFLHADPEGSVIATTNSSGVVTNKISYSPTGESNSISGTIFGFRGQQYEASFGIYNDANGSVYNPEIGRKNQPYQVLGGNEYSVSSPRSIVPNSVRDSDNSVDTSASSSPQSLLSLGIWDSPAVDPNWNPKTNSHESPANIDLDLSKNGGAASDKKKLLEELDRIAGGLLEILKILLGDDFNYLIQTHGHADNILFAIKLRLEMLISNKLGKVQDGIFDALMMSAKGQVPPGKLSGALLEKIISAMGSIDGITITGSQVRIETPFGVRIMDFEGSLQQLIEVKSGLQKLSKLEKQIQKDQWLVAQGRDVTWHFFPNPNDPAKPYGYADSLIAALEAVDIKVKKH